MATANVQAVEWCLFHKKNANDGYMAGGHAFLRDPSKPKEIKRKEN